VTAGLKRQGRVLSYANGSVTTLSSGIDFEAATFGSLIEIRLLGSGY